MNKRAERKVKTHSESGDIKNVSMMLSDVIHTKTIDGFLV